MRMVVEVSRDVATSEDIETENETKREWKKQKLNIAV